MDIIITEGYTKAMKVFINKAAQYGAKLYSSKGKHLKFRDTLGHQISAPKTSSDFRAIRNFESELKGRGFINQQTRTKVKDALVNKTKETVLKPARPSASRQTTFKDFTQKYQPNVQGPKRSELQVQADNIIRSLQSNKRASTPVRRRISRAQLDAMDIPQKQKDALIRQGLVEKYTEDQKNLKLLYQYNQRNNPDNYIKRDPVLDLLKKKKGLPLAQGNTLTPQVAQLAPIEKENQLPGRFSDTFIRLKEPTVDTLKQRVKRYGNLQRMSDIYPNYP